MYRYPGNHVDSGIVTVPRKLKTRPGAPETHLAYITPDEEKILQQYKPGTPHRGPEEIPNYDSWGWDGSSGSSVTGGSTADAGSGSGGSGTGSYSWETSSNPWGNNYQEPYTPPKEVYKDPLPEDIIYDDKIADYSFSTPDVRSSVMDKRAFRKRIAEGGGSGWAQKTDSEMLAEAMHSLTNNPAYLNQPIFVPKDADWGKIKAAYDEALKTGNKEDFFSVIDDYVDITHGNPNLSYFDKVSGTDWDGWWKRPTTTSGGGDGGGWRGSWGNFGNWGGSSQYGNPYGRYSKANWHLKNKYNYDSPIAELFQQRRANPVQPQNIRLFTEMMANMNKGGIMGLRR